MTFIIENKTKNSFIQPKDTVNEDQTGAQNTS